MWLIVVCIILSHERSDNAFGILFLIHSYNIFVINHHHNDNKTMSPDLHDESDDDDMATVVKTIIRSVTKLYYDARNRTIIPILLIILTAKKQ